VALKNQGIYLRGLVEAHGHVAVATILAEAMKAGEIKSSDFSLRELAEGLCGSDWVRSLDARGGYNAPLVENVDSTAFANITGQIVYNAIMEEYNSPSNNDASSLMTVVPTSFLDGEKIAGITGVQGDPATVGEGMPYPEHGLAQNYINTPATTKQGMIVSVTKEAVAKDRTGVLLQRCANVGERAAIEKNKRCWDALLGITNTFSWQGTSYNTYQASTPWINTVAKVLTDWTDVDEALQLFAEMVNPDQSGEGNEPYNPMPDTLIVPPSLQATSMQIANATMLEVNTASAEQRRIVANHFAGKFNVISSPWMYHRLVKSGVSAANARINWLFGAPSKAFRYMQAWPMTVVQAPPNNPLEFERDIVARWKASERGVPAVWQPRAMCKFTH